MIKYDIRKNAYYDSVTLMLISKEVKNIEGVTEALVGMGTDLNKELTVNLKLNNDDLDKISVNDFYIAAEVDSDETMQAVIDKVNELLSKKKAESGSVYQPVSLKMALEMKDDLNLAIVSIPGKYAEEEVHKLLDNDLHVMLFSDNVSIEAEVALKKKAVGKGLLMMGPDCGTAIINGVPLAFANVVKRGGIGIVGASGTGTQEVTCLIDQLGAGVSQVIGTGGRDLKSQVGGLMMIQAMKALMDDPMTEVITLISKPPAPQVAAQILEMVKETDKPVVVDFIGGDQKAILYAGAYPCSTLEEAARKSVALLRKEGAEDFIGFDTHENEIGNWIEKGLNDLSDKQVNLRGLYTGGTLADEAMKILGGKIYSNIPLIEAYRLEDLNDLKGHVVLDLGEDQFTVGRPHPMIDPSTRNDHFISDVDETTAVILLDVVLGYGSHENPAKEVADSVRKLKERLGLNFFIVSSVTGTVDDPQGLNESRKTLEDEGIIVMPSNAQAVRLVKMFMEKGGF
ncbi:acyl-CoA synthetase FdrA [Acidaminobacter sp. JC074]|uniref:acyl-CoA synthetase FdrA n=1 Tax=Acidaminobacter sp. JC074 TaxID=2530199 RepID=UPI001F10AA9C|nr:acyl-CoA synthetase FdrA [Acidaminobacter sp. JC074]